MIWLCVVRPLNVRSQASDPRLTFPRAAERASTAREGRVGVESEAGGIGVIRGRISLTQFRNAIWRKALSLSRAVSERIGKPAPVLGDLCGTFDRSKVPPVIRTSSRLPPPAAQRRYRLPPAAISPAPGAVPSHTALLYLSRRDKAISRLIAKPDGARRHPACAGAK